MKEKCMIDRCSKVPKTVRSMEEVHSVCTAMAEYPTAMPDCHHPP